MTTPSPIRRAVVELRAAQHGIRALTTEAGEDWRRHLVRRRRDLAERVSAIFALLDALPDPAGSGPFRSALSSVRGALARHQASWPAVAVDIADPAYAASVGEVRATYDTLEAALDAWERGARIAFVPTGE